MAPCDLVDAVNPKTGHSKAGSRTDLRASCSDPSVMVSPDAPETTRYLWWLHGHPHSKRYSNPALSTLGALVKYNAEVYRDQVAFMYPISNKPDTPYLPVSWGAFHSMTDVLAKEYSGLLMGEITFARATQRQPTIAFLGGGTTLEYFTTQMALQKLNLRVLLLADKSSSEAVQDLLTKCHALAIIIDLRNTGTSTGIRQIPMLNCRLDQTVAESADDLDILSYEDDTDPWERHTFVLHSSGSTGPPKPIVHTNRSMMLIARMYRLFPSFHVENWFLLFPLYHIAGISIMLSGLPNGMTTSLPPLSWPPSPSSLLKAWETLASLGYPIDCVHCAPIIIENLYEHIVQTNNDFVPLSALRVLQPGGAKLSEELVSKLISHGVNVKTTYGSTEIGPPMRSIPHSRDSSNCYSLRCLYPDSDKFQMEHVGGGLYECVIHRGFELAAELWDMDDEEPYRTNDLFLQDPRDSRDFILQGRRDDFLVHSDGNNTSAGALQLDIQAANPEIKQVLVVGHSRICVGVLLELRDPEKAKHDSFNDILWSRMQKVNTKYPRYSQMLRSMIRILPRGSSLPVTPKGNVKRNETIATYKDVIDDMYRKLDAETKEINDSVNSKSLSDLIINLVSIVSGVPQAEISGATSFYDLGIDSHSALQLRLFLSKQVGKIKVGTIYENPSVDQLVAYFEGSNSRGKEEKHLSFISRTIMKYTSEITSWPPLPIASPEQDKNLVILLTGATGSLGTALLESLFISPEISKIFVLIRGSDGLAKLRASLEVRKLDLGLIFHSGKLQVLNYSMKDPLLGLDIDTYYHLSKTVTTVLHCAWKVNFNQTVEDFDDDCLRGTVSLMRFCHSGKAKVFSFISSVSTCMGKGFEGIQVPEEPVGADPTVALRSGYAQSKFIAERLVQAASQILGMHCVLLRVGQLCGHTETGYWGNQEMYPIMFATSFRLNTIPIFKHRQVDWLPVDMAAMTIRDILTHPNPHDRPACTSYNIVNPNPVPWSHLISLLQRDRISAGSSELQETSIYEWCKRLAELETQGDEIEDVPALKLLQFFEGLAQDDERPAALFSTTKGAAISRTLRDCPPINRSWIECYLQAWRRSGFVRDSRREDPRG